MRKTWRIVQHIFENVDREPILTHVFYGETRERAGQVFDAHMQTDSFMRGCERKQKFRDFACHTENYVERMNERGEWVPVIPGAPR